MGKRECEIAKKMYPILAELLRVTSAGWWQRFLLNGVQKYLAEKIAEECRRHEDINNA